MVTMVSSRSSSSSSTSSSSCESVVSSSKVCFVLWLLSLLASSLPSSRVAASPLFCLDPSSCQLGEENRNVACSDSGIDIVPLCLNPSLISISLHNTRIHTLYVTSFRYYSDLKFINLSKNQISKIEKGTFEYQEKLEELHLRENKISYLYSDIFQGLKNLNVLILRGNLVEEVPDGVFQLLPHLEHLDLSHNRITTVGEDMLRGLPRLTVLLLSQNRLHSVPAKSLKQIPHLAEFSIGGNAFTEIHTKDFEALRSLTFLDLSSTDLSAGVASDAFEYIPGLRSLRLNDCQLQEVPVQALSALPELEELEMNRNLFVDIPKGAFGANRKLRFLTITGSPRLERISPGALQDNLNLVHVDVSRNSHLTFLPPQDFRFLTRLSFLDLHGNHLEYIPHNAVSWADVATWHLHDNPITCNCSSAWLRKMLIDSNHTAPPTILCASPPDLSGLPLAATEMSDLFCGLDPATQGIVIALSVCGLALIIACVAFFLIYRNRGSCVRQLLKGQKWGRNGRNSNHRSYDSEYPCIKSVPVTEL